MKKGPKDVTQGEGFEFNPPEQKEKKVKSQIPVESFLLFCCDLCALFFWQARHSLLLLRILAMRR